jgi:hypothetical protein
VAVVGTDVVPVLVIVLVVGLPLVIVDPVPGVDPVEPVVGAVVAVVPVDPVVVELAGAHDSDTFVTGTDTGSDRDDSGVPAGTFITNDSCPPPATVTVTVQVSAEASGTAEMAAHVTRAPAVAKATRSFRPLNTVVCLLPPSIDILKSPSRGEAETVPAGPGLCNAVPSPPDGRRAGRRDTQR